MGGDQDLDMETCSLVGSEVSSLDGDHADPSEAQDSLAFVDEVVYADGQADNEGDAPAGGSASLYQPCISTPCIENYMENGAYGMLRKLVSAFGGRIPLNKKLPQVIFVGDESHGKTSTLARILHRLILPSSGGMTTRCPIRLRLRHDPTLTTQRIYLQPLRKGGKARDVSHVADLVPLIVAEMDRVCGDSPMSMKEVVVSISSPHVPNLELVDLPGLAARPEAVRVTSEALVRKYAAAPNSLLLCAVEASAGSPLNNSYTLAMLESMGRLGDTLLVLTKMDTVPAVDLKYKSEMLGPQGTRLEGLAGAVGLMNPHHTELTPEGLAGAEERERALCAERLPWLVYGRDVGITALLSMLMQRLHVVIVTQWVPQAQRDVAAGLANVLEEVKALGDAPCAYNGDVSRLLAQLCSGSAALLAKLTGVLEVFLADNALARKGRAEAYSVLNRSHVRERRADREEVRGVASRLMMELQEAALDHIEAVLRDAEPSVDNVERLARFPKLREACEKVAHAQLEALGRNAWAEVEATIAYHFQRVAGRVTSPSFGTELFRAIAEAFVAEMLVPLEDLFAGPLHSEFQRRVEEPPCAEEGGEEGDLEARRAAWVRGLLVESEEVASRRTDLKESYDKHQHALDCLERMRNLQYGQTLE